MHVNSAFFEFSGFTLRQPAIRTRNLHRRACVRHVIGITRASASSPTDKSRRELDFEAKVSVREGLEETVARTHNTVHNGVIDIMGQWREHLSRNHGVRLSVYNPKSLMTRSLPLFSWD